MREAGAAIESLRDQIINEELNMSISTFQKITIVSCVVLCVALLLPKILLSRGKRDSEGTRASALIITHASHDLCSFTSTQSLSVQINVY